MKAGRPTTALDAVCAVVHSLGRATAARVAEELDWDHARAAHALRRAAMDERITRENIGSENNPKFLYGAP